MESVKLNNLNHQFDYLEDDDGDLAVSLEEEILDDLSETIDQFLFKNKVI